MQNILFEVYQSAYRQNCCTEVVLSVLNKMLEKTDERSMSVLALLDLSAAFDHNMLFERLSATWC